MSSKVFKEQRVMENRYSVPYNWCIKDWSRHWRQKNGLWSIAKGLAGDLRGKKVLDAGCGDGWYSAKMKKEGAIVSGVDYSERAISFASAIVKDADFAEASLTQLPFPDKSFDVIFSFQVIEHIPPQDLPRVFLELSRVLRNDGDLIISVPSTLRQKSDAHFQHFSLQTLARQIDPYFKIELGYGQEHHGLLLHTIERMLENRIWLLPNIAIWFNRSIFTRYWNRVVINKGQNIVVKCKKIL